MSGDVPTPTPRRTLFGRHALASALGTVALAAAGLTGITLAATAHHAPAQRHAARSALAIAAGAGATVPFTEYEAEAAATNGTVLAPSRLRDTLAGESTGRSAVTLSGAGKYVEFTLTAPANAVDVRYSIPDSSGGSAYTAPLAVYVNGGKSTDLTLTNKYSWFYGSYPFTNNPGDGNPHHFYDDVRTMFGSTLAAGTKVRFQVDSGSTPETVDVADFENVPAAIAQPAGSLSATDYGADPTGAKDSGGALTQAISAASSQGRTLYLPAGSYQVNQHLILNKVTVRGAGPWYTTLTGDGVGLYGNYAPNPSTAVTVSDLAIFGNVTDRNDGAQVNGLGGALGGGSVVSNVWIQHTKVALWLDGPFDGLKVTGCRMQDLTADGLNLHDGISNVTVDNNFIRNTGDDGLAMWSDQNADHHNTFSHNTVELPMLANGIAVYGGHDNAVTGDVVADTQTNGGGIHVANRFNSVLLSGTTTVSGDTTLRAGNLDPNWQFGVGALWFDALNGQFGGTVAVSDTSLLDSSYEAIQWVEGGPITGVTFNNVTIDGTGTFALQLQTGGSASFTNVTAKNIGYSNPIYSCEGNSFTINQGTGNSGWYTATPYCGGWPPPSTPSPTPTATSPTPTPTTPTPTTTTAPPQCGNVALNRPATASSTTQNYVAANANDGNASTYWESANGAFPQWLQVDLGAATSISRMVLKLPPSTAWGARTQTLTVTGSTDGSTFTTLLASRDYSFDPATGNTATVTFPAATTRYVRLTFTANTGWPAGQAGELELYGT